MFHKDGLQPSRRPQLDGGAGESGLSLPPRTRTARAIRTIVRVLITVSTIQLRSLIILDSLLMDNCKTSVRHIMVMLLESNLLPFRQDYN